MPEAEKTINQERGVNLTKNPKSEINPTKEGHNPSREEVVFRRKHTFATLVEDEKWKPEPHPFKKSMRSW